MPPGSEAALFAPFTRLDGGAGALGDRGTGGLGLGLAVARGFAEAMHGGLTAHPTPGGGLTMRLTLPLGAPLRGARTPAGAGRAVSTVLVVDDDPALVRALSINLRARGYEVHAADTGAGALRLAASHPPDAVVLDLGLPDMDGSEVIAGLRGWTDVPILVLSAREQSRQKVAALDAGADDYVVKPFGMDELLARLRAAIRRGTPGAGAADHHHRRLHRRPVRRPGHRRRQGRQAHPDGVAPARGAGPATRAGWSTTAGCSPRCGARPTGSRPTTCACTWPRCAASSSPTRPTPATCSPRPAAGTASSRESRAGRGPPGSAVQRHDAAEFYRVGVAHPLAGVRLSSGMTMLFGPRDAAELETVVAVVAPPHAWASGHLA